MKMLYVLKYLIYMSIGAKIKPIRYIIFMKCKHF